jgi:hypothetical protein
MTGASRRAKESRERGDWREHWPILTCGGGGTGPRGRIDAGCGAVRLKRRHSVMRGPYGIVGVIVTIVVIYLVLHFLLGVI